jgi:hypothetical protein
MRAANSAHAGAIPTWLEVTVWFSEKPSAAEVPS